MNNFMKCESLTTMEHQAGINLSKPSLNPEKIFQLRKRFSFSRKIRYLGRNCSQRHGDAKNMSFGENVSSVLNVLNPILVIFRIAT